VDDFRTSFLTYYIQSLGERTREEGEARNQVRLRLDHLQPRAGGGVDSATDCRFLRAGGQRNVNDENGGPSSASTLPSSLPDEQTLRIFVLKDEVLKNSTWGAQSFDIDLRKRKHTRFVETRTEHHQVRRGDPRVQQGRESHRRRVVRPGWVAALGTRVGDHATLRFDRWNLTAIVNRVKSSLLTPVSPAPEILQATSRTSARSSRTSGTAPTSGRIN